MSTAALLRHQIEQSLQARIPAALTPRPTGVREQISCGIPALDELTHGGFPVGALAELVGPACSGRTTAALSFLASVTSQGNVCAWIDVADALDPEAAAANGVDLDRMLWVRCNSEAAPAAAPESAATSESVHRTAPAASAVPAGGGGSPHPRSEGRGMPEAISTLLAAQPGSAAVQPRRRDRRIGTPGAPNRPLLPHAQHLREREEQIATDRLPPRRGDNLQAAPTRNPALMKLEQPAPPQPAVGKPSTRETWTALDKALRSADLLLQAGGFQAMVLDLGSTPAEQAWRIPVATWFRFRAACERSRVSFLLLTQHPCARSSAELVLRMYPGSHVFQGQVMTGVAFHSEMDRQRQHRTDSNPSKVVAIRKPPQAVRDTVSAGNWHAKASWIRAR